MNVGPRCARHVKEKKKIIWRGCVSRTDFEGKATAQKKKEFRGTEQPVGASRRQKPGVSTSTHTQALVTPRVQVTSCRYPRASKAGHGARVDELLRLSERRIHHSNHVRSYSPIHLSE